METKQQTIGEIWDIMPKRMQGMFFMLLINISIMLYQEILMIVQGINFWIDLGLSLLLIYGIFWIVKKSYNWMIL